MAEKTRGQPVHGFPIQFEWHTGDLYDLFEQQVEFLKGEIAKARAEDRVVVYLSCPISARGGGYHVTNVDIAKQTERRLMDEWGERFWILNPAMYQMESREGRSQLQRLAEKLGIGPERFVSLPRPEGGDYMRMWTRVLVEDSVGDGRHLARDFDAFYFLGPSDVRHFFARAGAVTLTAGVEEYFARQFTMDPDFRDHYSVPAIDWRPEYEMDSRKPAEPESEQRKLRDQWEKARKWFFRFYALRASANFSLGSHDEWNIFRLVNRERLKHASETGGKPGDVGDLLAGYFDGKQVSPGSAVVAIDPGYAVDCGETSNTPRAQEDDRAAILRLRDTAAEAYRRGDIETLLRSWHPEGVYMLPNQPALRGLEAIRSSYEAVFSQFSPDIQYTGEEVEVVGDWAFGRFSSTTALTPKSGGAPLRDEWKGVHVYRRQADGAWKYWIVIGNSNTPPQGATGGG